MTKEEELQTLREENRTLKALVAELGTIQKRVLRHRFSIVGATSDPSPTQNHMLRMHEADFNPIEMVSQHPFLNGLLILHKLVNATMQAEQWERARGIAFSIEDPSHKREALAQLAERLIEMKQWERAKAVTYAIDHLSERSHLLSQLSQAIESDERWGHQAQFMAYDSDIIAPSPPSWQPPLTSITPAPQYPTAPMSPRSPIAPAPLSRTRRGCLLLAAALLVAIALSLFLFLGKIPVGIFYFLLWGTVGIMVIYVMIRIISFIRDR